ncbi:hypothetical protein [Terrimicrobium sacchariphilum]|nr:hypothetical protein [Terrimicrobium sacchariphilum]
MRSLVCWTICAFLFAMAQPARASKSPRELALRALEAQRTEDDRRLTTLTVPDPAPGCLPNGAEIFVVSGYINYRCVRLFMQEGNALLQRITTTRSWFYSPEESYVTEEWELPPTEFAAVWEAARLISQSTAVRKKPARPKDPDGKFVSDRRMVSMSSHEPTYYVRVWSASRLWWDHGFRGMSASDKVQDFEKVQTRAMTSLIETAFPEGTPGKPFALSAWGPFLAKQLEGSAVALQGLPQHLTAANTITIDCSLRLLGQMGYEPARPIIKAVAEDAEKSPSAAYWKESVLRECGYALRKIAIQERFDGEEVDRLIHSYGRRLNPDNDMVQWLRNQYFAKNPEAYFSILSRDLTAKNTPEVVLLESIKEVQDRYPSAGGPLLAGVLDHPSTEVSVHAAMALLKSSPDDAASLQALTRAASDPRATIPNDARSFSDFGREIALDYLSSRKNRIPPQYRWDSARIDQQLALPWEDGRMINRLISARVCLENKQFSDRDQITAYRKALAEPYTMGTAEACEELIKLDDRASADRIKEVLSALRAGCNKGFRWEEDRDARYPWIGKADLTTIEESLPKILH